MILALEVRQWEDAAPVMERRALGKDGPKVPTIGLGAWPIGGGMGSIDERESIRTIRWCLDNGIALIDTAEAYRGSEVVVGKALKDGYRDRCFLATKVSFRYDQTSMRAAMDKSLQNLGVDHVDLYQIHSFREEVPLEEQIGALAELQREGKTRYIGVSNYSVAQMRRAVAVAPIQSTQPAYNLFNRGIEKEELAFCRENGVGILAHSTLAKGLLTGKYRADHRFPEEDERSRMPAFQGKAFARSLETAGKLEAIARSKGISLVQLAIAWTLRKPEVTCALAGAKSVEQAAEYLGAVEVELTSEERNSIRKILADKDAEGIAS